MWSWIFSIIFKSEESIVFLGLGKEISMKTTFGLKNDLRSSPLWITVLFSELEGRIVFLERCISHIKYSYSSQEIPDYTFEDNQRSGKGSFIFVALKEILNIV